MKFKGLLKVALLLVAVSALFVACDTLAGGKFPVMFEPYEPEEGYIYLKPNANWLEKDGSDVAPRFAVYTAPKDWSSADWYDMEETEKDSGIYKVKLPAEKKYHWVIFTRMNGGKAENNWDNKYNQSKDEVLVYADDDASNDKKVLYIVADGSWDKSPDSFWHNPEEYVGNTVKYTVTFTADSGVTGVPEKQEVKENTQINAPAAAPAKEGYIFEGWYEGNTKITFPYTVTKDVTLTAKFTKVWKVTFASDPTGAKDLPAALTVADGEKVTKPTKDPSITKGTFKGWDFDFDKAITADTTITAEFEMAADVKYYTVKWEGVTKAEEKVVEGAEIAEPTKPTKEGSEFLGWFVGETKITFPYEVKSDVTITAKFQELKKYTVTFAECDLSPVVVTVGTKINKPATDPTKENFVFTGWYIGDDKVTFPYEVKSDVTITAKYLELKEYTVSGTDNSWSNILLWVWKDGEAGFVIDEVSKKDGKITFKTEKDIDRCIVLVHDDNWEWDGNNQWDGTTFKSPDLSIGDNNTFTIITEPDTVTISVTHDAGPGKSVYITGSFSGTDGWTKGVEAKWSEGNVWTATVKMFPGDKWKPIVFAENGKYNEFVVRPDDCEWYTGDDIPYNGTGDGDSIVWK